MTSERPVRLLLILVAAAGVLLSAYLTWTHLRGVIPVCAGGGGGCEVVQTSRYSEVLGVPVAALGLVAYATLIVSAVLVGEKAVLLGLFVALVGVLYSAYLTYLELFVIGAVCQWCLASAALMVASLILTGLRFGLGAK